MSTVTQFERKRLLDAMLEEMEEKGEDACFYAAYERLTERLSDRARESGEAAYGEWPQRVHAGLQGLLEALAAQPRMARALTRSFPTTGPEARGLYVEFVEGFAPLLREGREFSGMAEELPTEVEMLAVGAAEAIVFEEIEAGRTTQLPALSPEILFSVLVPFLGPDAASAEMQNASEEMEQADLEAA